MNAIIKFEHIENKIITLRGLQVILDSDVASLYGVQTKEINQAVKNNPYKFPKGYILSLTKAEKTELVKNFDQFNSQKTNDENKKQQLLKKSSEMIAEIFDNDLANNESETSIEINFAVLKFKHTIKKKKDN